MKKYKQKLVNIVYRNKSITKPTDTRFLSRPTHASRQSELCEDNDEPKFLQKLINEALVLNLPLNVHLSLNEFNYQQYDHLSGTSFIKSSSFVKIPNRTKQSGQIRQLAFYPRQPNGSLHDKPRVANYCKMDHANGRDMAYEYKRLATFTDWPIEKAFIKPVDLAKAGFFHDKTMEHYDRVKCAFCRGVLHSWEVGDEPIKEHRRAFSTCPFILAMDVSNTSTPGKGKSVDFFTLDVNAASISTINVCDTLNCGGVLFKRCATEFMNTKARMKSFPKWIIKSSLSNYEIRVLVRNGFYFTKGDKQHTLKCFKCHFEISILESETAVEKHRNNLPFCPYLKAIEKSLSPPTRSDMNQSVGSGLISDSEMSTRYESWASKQTLILGFHPDIVRHVLRHYCHFSGEDVRSLETLVSDIELLKGDMQRHNIDLSNMPLALQNWEEILEQRGLELKKRILDKNNELINKIKEDSSILLDYWDSADMAKTLLDINKNDLTSQERLNGLIRKEQQCKICMDQIADTVFIPCHHIVACRACSNSLVDCPICRNPIENTIQANLQ